MTVVALAGPIANFAVAVVAALLFRGLDMAGLLGSDFGRSVGFFVVYFNLALGFFNLLPVPPLDGYNVLLPLLPPRQAFTVQRYAQYGYLVLLGLVVLSYGSSGGPLDWLFGLVGGLAAGMTGA